MKRVVIRLFIESIEESKINYTRINHITKRQIGREREKKIEKKKESNSENKGDEEKRERELQREKERS